MFIAQSKLKVTSTRSLAAGRRFVLCQVLAQGCSPRPAPGAERASRLRDVEWAVTEGPDPLDSLPVTHLRWAVTGQPLGNPRRCHAGR